MNIKQYVRFAGYNKNSKIPTLSLNSQNNKYCCCRCGVGGYSIGLYAKIRGLSTKQAYRELLERECFSVDISHIEISPINLLADIKIRDTVYREFLSMLKLEGQHKNYLQSIGLLNSSIDEGMYKTVPKNYIKRRIIAYELSKKYNLCGIPGMFKEEDFKWCFSRYNGFFVPVFDENNYIQGLSIHLDKSFNNSKDIWFSSSNKIDGTATRNWIMRANITEESESILITDNLLLGNLIKNSSDIPIIAFQNISNSYLILKELERTHIKNVTFVLRELELSNNIDYIINRIMRDLVPLGYNIDIKFVRNFRDFFVQDFNVDYTLKEVA